MEKNPNIIRKRIENDRKGLEDFFFKIHKERTYQKHLLHRTRIIGCLFTTSILLNIILQDTYFGVNWGALKAEILYQSLI